MLAPVAIEPVFAASSSVIDLRSRPAHAEPSLLPNAAPSAFAPPERRQMGELLRDSMQQVRDLLTPDQQQRAWREATT